MKMPQSIMLEQKEEQCCLNREDNCISLELTDNSLDLSGKGLPTVPSEVVNFLHLTKLFLDHNDIESVPSSLNSLQGLRIISLTGNQLKDVPDCLCCLLCLEELYLSENEINIMSENLSNLKSLKILKLTANKLKQLPESLGELSQLQTLYIEENSLETLPSTIGLLENLEILDLCDNKITDLPVSIGRLKSLKILNLSNNKLDGIPETIGDMPSLETVDLSLNNIEILPMHFKSTATLKKIFLDRNRITYLPDWISELRNIEEFSANDNHLFQQALAENFGTTCVQIKVLDLGGNFMNKLPDSFGCLKSLEKLHLGSVIDELERRNFQNGNWISYLPQNFCYLINLKEIHLDENQLHELPDDFGNLVNLEFLDIGQNLLYELPESFGQLKALRICQLSKNNLQLLPSSFGNLTSLEDLRLDNNLLAELPESFCSLTNLKTLDLFNNKLTEIPSALKYFTKLVRLDLGDNHFKIPWDEVPQIITQSRYPERDPSLKNNWRGRPRQDLSMIDDQIIKINEVEVEEFELPPPSLNYSDDVLRAAAENNLSIWKSHNGNKKREKFVRKWKPIPTFCQSNKLEGETESDEGDDSVEIEGEEDDDEEFEPPIFVSKNPRTDAEVKPLPVVTTGENWDDEIEDINIPEDNPYKFTDIYTHPAPRTLAEAGYIVDNHLFLPYDMHSQPLVKQRYIYPVEEGQFDDDCDDLLKES